jgi:dimethylargininase
MGRLDPMSRPLAFVRSVPDSFSAALSGAPKTVAIDVSVAREQHAQYVASLTEGGFRVETLATPAALADGPFIEDTGVLLAGTLVLTRPGAPSRRAEVAGVGEALEDRFDIRTIEAPGTLEGGDVLRIGNRLYVGRSTRTNDDGIQQLAAIAAEQGIETVPVSVRNTLHLKSVVTALDDKTLLAAPGHFDPVVFSRREVRWVTGEREVNVLALPNSGILIPTSKAVLQEIVAAAGYEVTTVDVSEFEKADGGLTCLSLRTNGS